MELRPRQVGYCGLRAAIIAAGAVGSRRGSPRCGPTGYASCPRILRCLCPLQAALHVHVAIFGTPGL
eukprot:8095665-Pyramimonas_sp.AAC.1